MQVLDRPRLSPAWLMALPEDVAADYGKHLEFNPHDTVIDPLIEPCVRVLQENGIHTIESCQGTPGHYAHEFHGGCAWIRFTGDAAEGHMAYALALKHEWPVRSLAKVWKAHYRSLEIEGPDWEMLLSPFTWDDEDLRRLP